MKYFKDKKTKEVYAYDQEQIDGGWVKDGLVPMTDKEVHAHLNPPPPPPVIPREVTMRQARLQLHKLGMLKDVQPAIDSLDEPQRTEAQIEWDYATNINRDNASVQLLIEKLELTDEQVDEWFLEASKL